MTYHSFDKIMAEAFSEDRLLTAIMAVFVVALIGLLIGSFNRVANPPLWNLCDRLFGGLARKMYNKDRSRSSLAFRGTVFTILYIGVALVLGIGAHAFDRAFPLKGFTEPLVLSLTMTGGAVWYALNTLYHALAEGKALHKGSYYPIAASSRSDLNTTDNYGITRVGIGFMAQSFDKALIAPLFWYLIGGLPLAYLYAGIAAARWGLAKEGFAKGLGNTSLWLERIFGLIPHLLSGIWMACAALFTPGAQLSRAIPGFFSSTGRAPYAEGGLPLTAVAWAMNVSLGGPVRDLEGSALKKAWVGPPNATAKVDKSHLRRVIYMSVMGYVLLVAALIGGLLLHRLAQFS
jgi:adenosylcobinamide-phosphate synthase